MDQNFVKKLWKITGTASDKGTTGSSFFNTMMKNSSTANSSTAAVNMSLTAAATAAAAAVTASSGSQVPGTYVVLFQLDNYPGLHGM